MIHKDHKSKQKKTQPFKQSKKKNQTSKKSKAKPTQKFNPKLYFQALLNLQNTNCSTNRKGKMSKRDISSALTIATPALEKTISTSKIRSKSSFSHYKKKGSQEKSKPIVLDVYAIITEQSNVQYSQTVRDSFHEEAELKQLNQYALKNISKRKHSQDFYARKIQRAWKNYKTYKMICQHYQIQQKLARQEENLKTPQFHIKMRKQDFEKTLKIKKQHQKKQQIRRDEQLIQTQKIINERFKKDSRKDIESNSPIFGMVSSEQLSEKSNTFLYDMKQRQAQRFNEAIDIIQNKSKEKTKQELIEQLIQKFEHNKKILEQDIRKQLQFIQIEQKQSHSSKNGQDSLSKKESMSSLDLKEMMVLSDGSSFFNQQSIELEVPQVKIFYSRLDFIKKQRQKALQSIDTAIKNGQLSVYKASKKKGGIIDKYESQRKDIEKNRKQYIFSLTNLKRNALKYQYCIMKSSSLGNLKKSFSAGNVVIKSILQGMKDHEISVNNFQNDFIDSLFKDTQTYQLPNTPIKSQVSNIKQSQISEGLLQSNTQIMKKYSEQIQQSIQSYLFKEITHEIYGNQNLYQYIKGYIEHVFQFSKIKDQEIIQYFHDLQLIMPPEKKILERVNQKINPTSLQILKIIRDLSFQIDQYELIIPQETFKKYRQNLELEYKILNARTTISKDYIVSIVQDNELVEIIYSREIQKNQKNQKYRNFERDLKIMYMKAVFNCLNEFMIQTKSLNAFMNGRSSIGPGQLTFAIKQYNQDYDSKKYQKLLKQVEQKLIQTLDLKCSIPSLKNYADLQLYQRQIMNQIKYESNQNEYKWVNYMDQILEIWQEISSCISQQLINEVAEDFLTFF